MYEDYCLDMEETRFCFEISNSPSTIIWRPAPNLTCSSVGRASTSKPKVAGKPKVRIPAGPSRFFSTCPVWFVTRGSTSLLKQDMLSYWGFQF